MWKCKFCNKANFDDQKVCLYCAAPNPDAPQAKQAEPQPEHAQAQEDASPRPQDWDSRNNPIPAAQKKPATTLDRIVKYLVIAACVLLIVYLLTLLFKQPDSKIDASNATAAEASAAQASATLKSEPAVTPTPEPTREPIVADAVSELYLDYGETYHCSAKDFDLPVDIPDDEITWRCAKNDALTTCTENGLIEASDFQLDSEKEYNDEVIVTGTTKEGSVLTYHVFTGDGQTYHFDWSTSSRSMRGAISGYVIVSDKMITQCDGFSVYYEYELTKGKLDADTWSVWVREDGATWVRVQDIEVKNKVGNAYDIAFDRPITFNEIWIMPETYSEEYSYNSSFQIGYLWFD